MSEPTRGEILTIADLTITNSTIANLTDLAIANAALADLHGDYPQAAFARGVRSGLGREAETEIQVLQIIREEWKKDCEIRAALSPATQPNDDLRFRLAKILDRHRYGDDPFIAPAVDAILAEIDRPSATQGRGDSPSEGADA